MYQEGNPDISQRTRSLRGTRSIGTPPKPLYVAIVNDEHYYSIRQIVRSATATGTIFAVPNDLKRQFYIDGIILTAADDTDITTSREVTVSATIDGVAQVVGSICVGGLVGSAFNEAIAYTMATPLRIDNNTNITLTTTASLTRAIIYGHFENV